MDLLLDRTTHDLVIKGYDLQLVDDTDLIRQAIKQRLLLVFGEWFLDETIGVPWYQYIFQKGANINRVKSILINQIVGTEGVNSMLEFTLNYDKTTRGLEVYFTVDTVEGVIDVRFDK